MSEEIQFFGFGIRNSPYNQISLDGLKKYGISYPKTNSFSISELANANPDSFPWPLAVRIPTNNGFLPPKLVTSWSHLQDLIDEIRNPDSTILFSLPPQAPREGYIQNVFAYIGKGFICVHNPESGITQPANTSDFLSDLGLSDNWVVRLVRGYYGWFFDSYFDRNDPKLKPIFYTLESAQDKFIDGYRAAISSATKNTINNMLLHNFGSKTSVGDSYSSGYYLGSLFVNRLEKIAKTSVEDGFIKLDKSTLILSKLTSSEADFLSVFNMVSCHNEIVKGNLNSHSIKSACNPAQCNGTVPNTFTSCGEEGLYCSPFCRDLGEQSKLPIQLYVPLDATCKFLQEVSDSKKETPAQISIIETPSDIGSIQVSIDWTSKISQYRITSISPSSVTIRFQANDMELIQKVTCGEECYNIVSWRQVNNEEADIEVKFKYLKNETSFEAWLFKIKQDDLFTNKSTYSGSNQKYASLICNNEGFCLEDGTVVIPMSRFLKYLEKQKNIKIAIQ